MKGLKTQNLRDHMSEAELIFTALAELSTRQIAESVNSTGMIENAEAGKKGGRIAKRARLELEQKTGKSVVTGENFLPPSKRIKDHFVDVTDMIETKQRKQLGNSPTFTKKKSE
jgi:DNA-damage-inducible protein D